MSDYTKEQVQQVADAMSHSHLTQTDWVEGMLADLANAGITLKFPTYRVHQNHAGNWFVCGDGGEPVAFFYRSHPDPELAARVEAARLNGGSDE